MALQIGVYRPVKHHFAWTWEMGIYRCAPQVLQHIVNVIPQSNALFYHVIHCLNLSLDQTITAWIHRRYCHAFYISLGTQTQILGSTVRYDLQRWTEHTETLKGDLSHCMAGHVFHSLHKWVFGVINLSL